MAEFAIGNKMVGDKHPCYFIADVGSNHNGDLQTALQLIHDAKKAGADCVKFQHFRADEIVSDEGFKKLGAQLSHQAHWKDSVYDTYKKYEVPWEWTPVLAQECVKLGIEFMSTPYDLEAVDHLDPYVNAFKIGSGDITYLELLRHIQRKGKPKILSTGASCIEDVRAALAMLGGDIGILQCNTYYDCKEGVAKPFDSLNLNVIKTFKDIFPDFVPGLSLHMKGDIAPVAAVALGAKIIEVHFKGAECNKTPDFDVSYSSAGFETMAHGIRMVERMLGDGVKRVEQNELIPKVVQRRGWHDGKFLRPENVEVPF